ncbi:cysteine-rich motor neuron 1 protein-like [Diabrotica virgifera virgifera]|uniref:Antistasin-like domain-containing protein n=1 Tax=Diabrotica virgifera virgifera TaxID=50390 RepID=A0ABM5L129_DIAVI|nr:cysteine-rich motor neuron 1 protein-like [Diabrotica virgifera virgifera]
MVRIRQDGVRGICIVEVESQHPCTALLAAPSIEACPPDSVISEDVCKCDASTCRKPPCPTELQVAQNGTDLPGQCCPMYECVGCKDEDKINGTCPCGKGAVINGYKCECLDKEKHLVDGECVCDTKLCPILALCDKKSVAVTVTEGCCKKNICKPCPFDSESTTVEGDEIEDHCVCLPCKAECGFNKRVVIKRHGSGFPGNCCDLYECKKPEETKDKECTYNGQVYQHDVEWITDDSQKCKCDNGLALCSKEKEKEGRPCFVDNQLYSHSATWYKDDGCTACECQNGTPRCIAHYCDSVQENVVHTNETCTQDGNIHHHTDVWWERDGCTNCTCISGHVECNSDQCEQETTTVRINKCPVLENCNKTCLNGFKLNRKGCEICKCNSIRLGQDILGRYNISMHDLIKILDDYKNKRHSTTPATTLTTSGTTSGAPSSTTSSVSTSTRTVPSTISDKTLEIVDNHLPVVIMNRNAEFLQEQPTSTTTEPSVRPTDKETDWLIYVLIVGLAGFLLFVALVILCVYKGRRKSSIDLSHCQYQTVSNHNNNNTIRKTDQLL